MSVSTNTTSRVHIVTFLTDKVLKSIGDIVRDSGLSMTKFTKDRALFERGIKAWLNSGHLEYVVLEIYDSTTDKLIKKWVFEFHEDGDGGVDFWFNPEEIKYHLLKAGKPPATCNYCLIIHNKPGRPDVEGFVKGSPRDSTHLNQFSVGTTVSASTSNVRTNYFK
jgi:hypothetical protein